MGAGILWKYNSKSTICKAGEVYALQIDILWCVLRTKACVECKYVRVEGVTVESALENIELYSCIFWKASTNFKLNIHEQIGDAKASSQSFGRLLGYPRPGRWPVGYLGEKDLT